MLDHAAIDTATAYATAAGFHVAAGIPPIVAREAPSFDSIILRHVTLELIDPDATLSVYVDDGGRIAVIEDGLYNRTTGATVDRAGAIRAAGRHLEQAGVDRSSGTLDVSAHSAGHWYLTFDRRIAGYQTANAPMWWWLTGDKAYLELRRDGSLANLYAIRPDHARVPTTLATKTLNTKLAKIAGVSVATLVTYDLAFLWIRTREPASGDTSPVLTLAYCATHTFESGWEAWCVDPATGEVATREGGID